MFIKRDLPVLLGLVSGGVIIASNFLKIKVFQDAASYLLNWRAILAAYALGLGAANLYRLHIRRVTQKRTRYWQLSYWLLFMLTVTFVIGVALGPTSKAYMFIFDNFYTPLGATTFSIHAFFLVVAAFRSFRISNFESLLFMLAGVLVMLGQVGIGTALWSKLPLIRNWIMEIPNSAAMRAITAGSALGLVTLGLRVILGLERSHLGIGE